MEPYNIKRPIILTPQIVYLDGLYYLLKNNTYYRLSYNESTDSIDISPDIGFISNAFTPRSPEAVKKIRERIFQDVNSKISIGEFLLFKFIEHNYFIFYKNSSGVLIKCLI